MTSSFFASLWAEILPVLSVIASPSFLYSVLRLSTPILLATMAALVSDRAGVTNISIEGTMLFSALMGVVGSAFTQSCWVGLLVAIVAGMLFSLLLSFFHLWLKTNLVLTCIALNSLSSGLTIFILFMLTGDRGVSTALQSVDLPKLDLPLIRNIPFVGDVLSGHSVLTYLAVVVVILVAVLLYKTKLGTYIRAVGESPQAIETAGFPARRIRFLALLISGAIAGMGGAFMSMYYAMGWSQDMVAGRGFIALAAQAMGAGEPLGSMLSALVFGFAQALGIKVSALGADSNLVSPIPYLVTILGLVAFALATRRRIRRQHSAAALAEAAKRG